MLGEYVHLEYLYHSQPLKKSTHLSPTFKLLKCLSSIKKWLNPPRENYQGIVPPVTRSEEDFDAGAKYHVAADVPYIRYFASHILQFMFYKEMCQLSHQYDPQDPTKPLFKC